DQSECDGGNVLDVPLFEDALPVAPSEEDAGDGEEEQQPLPGAAVAQSSPYDPVTCTQFQQCTWNRKGLDQLHVEVEVLRDNEHENPPEDRPGTTISSPQAPGA